MKKKMSKILRTGLMLVLAMTLALGTAAPVVADPADNVLSNVGPMAVAPDGTIFASVFYEDAGDFYWKLMKSEDEGDSWADTELTELADYEVIVSVVVSPNYEEDETIYVGTYPGTVWRLEEAGEGDVIALKEIVDSGATPVSQLFCIDVWTDEADYNWILVGTDLDVLVLKDKTSEDWRDQELATGGNFWAAYEVAYAPDFEDSDLIWAVTESGDGDFWVVATVSPGQWGQDIGDAWLDCGATIWLDMDFPDDYDSDPATGQTIVYAGVTGSGGDEGVWLIEGVDADDGFSNTINLFDLSGDVMEDIVSIAVSGDYGDEVILAGEMWDSEIWISDDGGANWQEADKHPTGEGWTHVYMALGEFDPEEGVAYAATFGDESGVFRTDDGGRTWNPIVPPVPATIDIDPDTLNLKSKGKWITGYIELPEGYDVYDININTVVLNGEVPAESDPKYGFVKDPAGRIGDYDDDGIPDCMVKVDRSAVQGILGVGDAVEITVTGEVAGTPFEGSDIIRVK